METAAQDTSWAGSGDARAAESRPSSPLAGGRGGGVSSGGEGGPGPVTDLGSAAANEPSMPLTAEAVKASPEAIHSLSSGGDMASAVGSTGGIEGPASATAHEAEGPTGTIMASSSKSREGSLSGAVVLPANTTVEKGVYEGSVPEALQGTGDVAPAAVAGGLLPERLDRTIEHREATAKEAEEARADMAGGPPGGSEKAATPAAATTPAKEITAGQGGPASATAAGTTEEPAAVPEDQPKTTGTPAASQGIPALPMAAAAAAVAAGGVAAATGLGEAGEATGQPDQPEPGLGMGHSASRSETAVTPRTPGGSRRAQSHAERAALHDDRAAVAMQRKAYPAWLQSKLKAMGHRIAATLKQERAEVRGRSGSALATAQGTTPRGQDGQPLSGTVVTPAPVLAVGQGVTPASAASGGQQALKLPTPTSATAASTGTPGQAAVMRANPMVSQGMKTYASPGAAAATAAQAARTPGQGQAPLQVRSPAAGVTTPGQPQQVAQ